MKTFQNIAKTILIAATIVLTASCNKDDNPAPAYPVAQANSSFVKGKVDGVSFGSLVASCSKAGTGSSNVITVLGGDTGGNSISVVLSGVTANGTFTVNSSTDSVLSYAPGSGGVAYSTGECSAASGTITVTAIDASHVEGTFSFTGKDTENCSTGGTKTVTEGSFKGVFQN